MRIHQSAIVPMLALLGGAVLGSVSCGPKEPATPPASTAPAPAAPAKPEPSTPAPASPTPAPGPKTTQPVAQSPAKAVPAATASAATGAQAPAVVLSGSPAVPAQAPAPEAKPAAAPKPTLPPQATSPISDPGGEMAVKPTKGGLARVGTSACKMCHRVQFASWSETAHAKRTPPLDCESCHGQGSEYKSMAVMKDPARARAAGLVQPGPAFCATCHKRGWNDGMLKKAHTHKA